eukprot:scaffold248851_cov96-Cyclotella_meneghiniana.AAC.2
MARNPLKASKPRRRISGVSALLLAVPMMYFSPFVSVQADEAGAVEGGGSRGREDPVVTGDVRRLRCLAVGVAEHRDEVVDARAPGDGDGVVEDGGGGGSGSHCRE